MHTKLNYLFSILIFFYCCIFSGFIFGAPLEDKTRSLFQIVESQMILDFGTVEATEIIAPKNKLDKYKILLKLKPAAADELGQMTLTNNGKLLNLIIGNKLITSSVIQGKLNPELLITGLSKQDVQKFLKNISR